MSESGQTHEGLNLSNILFSNLHKNFILDKWIVRMMNGPCDLKHIEKGAPIYLKPNIGHIRDMYFMINYSLV